MRESSPGSKPRLLDPVRAAIRARHDSPRTEESCEPGPRHDDFVLNAGARRQGHRMRGRPSGSTGGRSASSLIDRRIAELGDWRGEALSRIRTLIKEADPDVAEEWKWRGTPVWSHDGIICTGESYKSIVKLTFLKGASLRDPARLFNSSLKGNARRAIDIHEGEKIDAGAFKALIRAAVALNTSGGKARRRREN